MGAGGGCRVIWRIGGRPAKKSASAMETLLHGKMMRGDLQEQRSWVAEQAYAADGV
jgi:hypothetical protein